MNTKWRPSSSTGLGDGDGDGDGVVLSVVVGLGGEVSVPVGDSATDPVVDGEPWSDAVVLLEQATTMSASAVGKAMSQNLRETNAPPPRVVFQLYASASRPRSREWTRREREAFRVRFAFPEEMEEVREGPLDREGFGHPQALASGNRSMGLSGYVVDTPSGGILDYLRGVSGFTPFRVVTPA